MKTSNILPALWMDKFHHWQYRIPRHRTHTIKEQPNFSPGGILMSSIISTRVNLNEVIISKYQISIAYARRNSTSYSLTNTYTEMAILEPVGP